MSSKNRPAWGVPPAVMVRARAGAVARARSRADGVGLAGVGLAGVGLATVGLAGVGLAVLGPGGVGVGSLGVVVLGLAVLGLALVGPVVLGLALVGPALDGLGVDVAEAAVTGPLGPVGVGVTAYALVAAPRSRDTLTVEKNHRLGTQWRLRAERRHVP
jgi:hypothetical protein